jgi:2-oxoglutarate ferredoxin oxidoreductase subunit gamma
VLIYDPNGITHPPTRTDIAIYKVDATQQAARMGNPRTFNMIVLGAMLQVNPDVVTLENAFKGLQKSLPERLHKTLPANREAIEVGTQIVERVQ